MYYDQPQQEQPQQPLQAGGYMPTPPDDDFFKFRIDGSDILEEIQHQLKGEVYDFNRKCFVQKFDRWINDNGISAVTHIMYACGINKNTFLGNLTRDEINEKCYMLKVQSSLLLFKKYRKFEVQKEMRNLLITTLINTIHSALSRSEGGLEARQISTAASRHDIYQYQQANRQGAGGSMMGLGGMIKKKIFGGA